MDELTKKRIEALAEKARGIDRERLKELTRRNMTIGFRVSPVEHADIQKGADRYGLGISEYLRQLHLAVNI